MTKHDFLKGKPKEVPQVLYGGGFCGSLVLLNREGQLVVPSLKKEVGSRKVRIFLNGDHPSPQKNLLRHSKEVLLVWTHPLLSVKTVLSLLTEGIVITVFPKPHKSFPTLLY